MKKCVVCNEEINRRTKERPGSFAKRKICSLKCRQRYIVKKKLEGFVPARCRKCGVEIHCTDKTGRRSSKRSFCSQGCQHSWMRRENVWKWTGGVKKHGEYRAELIGKDHPFADMHGYVRQHRLVYEKWLRENEPLSALLVDISGKKYLSPVAKIHHKNHCKSDNRIENLQAVTSQKEHFHFNYCPHCPHCNKSGELLENPSGTISSQAND